jgi:hypothetical protein
MGLHMDVRMPAETTFWFPAGSQGHGLTREDGAAEVVRPVQLPICIFSKLFYAVVVLHPACLLEYIGSIEIYISCS